MIDPHSTPPHRWVNATITRHTGPELIGGIIRQAFHELEGGPDRGLAERILTNEPNYLCGANAANGRTHALWALMVLRRDDELPVYLEPLRHACELWLKHRITPPIPAELLFMATYAWLRLDCAHDAKVAVVLCDRLRLSVPQREDLALLVASIPAAACSSTTPFH